MNRSYVLRCRYPDKKPFLLGTVVVDARAPDHEIRAAGIELWKELSPHPCPEIHEIIPGALFLKEET